MKDDDDYLFDRKGDADPDIARLEQSLGAMRYRKPSFDRVERAAAAAPTARTRVVTLVAALALAAAVLLFFALRRPPPGESFTVTRLTGAPRIASGVVEKRGQLPVGAWLETDGASRADIELARIGHVEVLPGSRVRLVSTAPNEQRLELAHGTIDALVKAPPRIFMVDTPSARATDLGCAYHLEVEGGGGGKLRVTVGAVELAGSGREAWVPASAACETRPGHGPGCPYFEDASVELLSALRRFDFEGGSDDALTTIIGAARPRDTLTLWHMQRRVSGEARSRILSKIHDLAPGNWSAEPTLDDLVTHW